MIWSLDHKWVDWFRKRKFSGLYMKRRISSSIVQQPPNELDWCGPNAFLNYLIGFAHSRSRFSFLSICSSIWIYISDHEYVRPHKSTLYADSLSLSKQKPKVGRMKWSSLRLKQFLKTPFLNHNSQMIIFKQIALSN